MAGLFLHSSSGKNLHPWVDVKLRQPLFPTFPSDWLQLLFFSNVKWNQEEVKTDTSTTVCKANPALQALGALRKNGQKDCESQRSREFAVILCLLEMPELHHETSPVWLPNADLNKACWHRQGQLSRVQHYTHPVGMTQCGQQQKRIHFPWEEHIEYQ